MHYNITNVTVIALLNFLQFSRIFFTAVGLIST